MSCSFGCKYPRGRRFSVVPLTATQPFTKVKDRAVLVEAGGGIEDMKQSAPDVPQPGKIDSFRFAFRV